MSDVYGENYKSIATWLPKQDYEKLKLLAQNNKVSISTYLRAIVTDVLFEEGELLNATLAAFPPDVVLTGGRIV